MHAKESSSMSSASYVTVRGPQTFYVVGEINVSSVFPIPDEAPAEIARRVADRLRSKLEWSIESRHRR